METLYFAMRGAARATWNTIKHIEGIEDLNKQFQRQYEQSPKRS